MELRDYIAFVLFMDELDWTDFFQGYHDEMGLEDYIKSWMEDKIPSLNEPHCGDCTKVPAPCTRCQTEEYYTEADQIIRAIKDYEDAKRESKTNF